MFIVSFITAAKKVFFFVQTTGSDTDCRKQWHAALTFLWYVNSFKESQQSIITECVWVANLQGRRHVRLMVFSLLSFLSLCHRILTSSQDEVMMLYVFFSCLFLIWAADSWKTATKMKSRKSVHAAREMVTGASYTTMLQHWCRGTISSVKRVFFNLSIHLISGISTEIETVNKDTTSESYTIHGRKDHLCSGFVKCLAHWDSAPLPSLTNPYCNINNKYL